LHATDFADRYERNIFPLIRAGYIVLADRYVYTAYARDVVRGCSYKWVCKVYDFAVKPDLIFYFRVPIDIAADRILSGRPKLKYYEAGMDLNFSNDEYESYRLFQSRIIDQYESMIDEEGFTVIDGTEDIEQQQAAVREKTLELIPQQQMLTGRA
jgi:dTMP kinase